MIDMITIGWLISCISIIGAVMNAKKIKWGFVLWTIANVLWIVFNVYTQTYSQIPIWIVFSIICVWGFITWSKEEE